MSSGACRALVALLVTLVALVGMALPVVAKSDALEELSSVRYLVKPDSGEIEVRTTFVLETRGRAPFQEQEWGPIIVEEQTRPSAPPLDLAARSGDLPGLWREVWVQTPTIPGGGERQQFVLRYVIDASIDQDLARRVRTPARVDSSYMYFCVPGQDTDTGSVTIRIQGNANRWQLTQNGTPLPAAPNGDLRLQSRTPSEIFTCIEGVRDGRLETDGFIGPAGRQIVLQAWRDAANWLQAAETQAEPVLDEIHDFLGIDIPGNGPVIIRHTPVSEIGGYAGAHDTPGVVQLDERGGTDDAEHQLAHAWFTTDNFIELWLREGLALWTASAMAGGSDDAACAAAGPNDQGLDLSDWQVVRPTSGEDIERIVADQDAAACGIISAIAQRLTPEQWRVVLGSMLAGETKYISSAGPEVAANPVVDYREFLDAVDERGLVPAGYEDLDFAQELLDEFGIPLAAPELARRSEARAYYHQFLADAAPMGAPLVVRKAMDDWRFEDAITAIDRSYIVLEAIFEADEKLPTAGLIPIIQRPFEDARDVEAINEVREEALFFLNEATALTVPLGELQTIAPAGWDIPAAISVAIAQRRFDDAMSAIDPARAVVQEIIAADTALPAAGFLEAFRSPYESTASASGLEDLADDARNLARAAERTGRALSQLESNVGDWQIPAAVTEPIERGQLSAAGDIIDDALAVVAAATAADIALPEAQLRSALRERFETVASPGEMAALRAEAEARREEAQAVGDARSTLRTLVPDWQIPEIVSAPIEAREFAAAAVTAAEAQRWVQNAADADENWDAFGALEMIRDDFENAQSLEELTAGADLAEQWAEAARYVRNAMDSAERDRDLLMQFGLWGVDVDTPLRETKEAALEGNVGLALNRSSEVQALMNNASRDGSLRLAGVVFLGIAVLGVMGLWVMLRRQRGPSWARESTPHWIEEKKRLPWRRSANPGNDTGKGSGRISGTKEGKRR